MKHAIHPALPLSNLKQGVAFKNVRGYIAPVAANSANGIGVPKVQADIPPQQRFFCVRSMASLLWAGRAVASKDAPVPVPGTPTPHGSAHPNWRSGSGKHSRSTGISSMTTRHILTLNPSKARANFHRACALAALHADSSLSVRLKRYNAAMAKARALEAAGGAL